MAVLELSLLPLDPPLMHYASYFAWLIAFFVASIATFSRLSLLSSVMEHGPFHMFISTKLHYHQLYTLRKATSSQAKQTIASHQSDSHCVDHEEEQEEDEEEEARQKEAEKKPWLHTPEIFSSGGGEDDEEQEQGIPPDWMLSLLEASAAYPEACLSRRKVLKPSFTSWSQVLDRRISMHAGKDWQVSMCQHLMQRSCKKEEALHLSGTQCSAADAAGIGYGNGGGCIGDEDRVLALWNVKKSFCLHALPYTQSMPLSWSFSGATIAGGPFSPGVKTSVVSLWDDRCPLQSASLVVVQATSPKLTVKGCGNQLAIAGKGVISLLDFRMLSGRPVLSCIATEG